MSAAPDPIDVARVRSQANGLRQARKQRDDLLAACEAALALTMRVLTGLHYDETIERMYGAELEPIRAAIARARGTK